jgi:hypothetical protein
MRKYLVAMCIVLGLAFIVAHHDEYAALNGANKTTDQNPTARAAESNEQQPQKNPTKSYWDTPGGRIFHHAFAWSEGTTIWAILLTLLAVSEQAHEAAKSTRAMRDSLKVQEAEFFQWLDMGDWEVEPLDEKRGGWSRCGTQIQGHPGPMNFRISFQLANNTLRPLFIHYARINLEIGSEKSKKDFLVEEAIQVPPKSEYKVVIDTKFTHDNVTEWLAYSVPILGVVDVGFSNALGRRDETRFERLVTSRWGPDGGTSTVSRGHKAEQIDQQAK